MKTTIEMPGQLVIEAENDLEIFALMTWADNFMDCVEHWSKNSNSNLVKSKQFSICVKGSDKKSNPIKDYVRVLKIK